MEINKLIESLKMLEKLQAAVEVENISENKPKKRMIGQYVIVRCRDAGVHSGYLEDYNGREVVLTKSRRLWFWKCVKEHSLSSVALYGLHDDSKIASELPEILLSDACEILPCSSESAASIQGIKSHEQ